MKIRLLILEDDSTYLQRVVSIFNNKFGNELEIYSFTEIDAAIQCLGDKNIDVFLASSSFNIDFTMVPKKCGFAYFVESTDIDRYNNQKAICKFQRAELIYKQILSLYAEQTPNIIGSAGNRNSSMKVITFSTPAGGTGTSTIAAACAVNLAGKGYRVLYLNLQKYGDADAYFSCDGQFDFSDIIYAVKSNKSNRTIKLQSTVKQDATGVSFYSSVKVALDILEFNINDYVTLLNELQALGEYDYVITDMDFPSKREDFKAFENCRNVVLVSDGTSTTLAKIDRMLKAVQIIDSYSEYSIQPRFLMIKNKSRGVLDGYKEIKVIGEFPLYESGTPAQLARQLSMSNVFEQLI
ncbi:MAG: AAA family ATPase [Clostridiales bacterium]|nr:AAA family ATPase [Clostridiales bacterium]